MRRRRAQFPGIESGKCTADQTAEKTRIIRIRTEEIYGGMILNRSQMDAALPALAASIARFGLLSPVVVRKNRLAGRYALICGARRLAACRLLGMREVDAVLIDADEQEAIACFAEELICTEPPSAMETAKAVQRADVSCMPEGAVRRYVRRLQKLNALPEPVREIALQGRLSLEQALVLLEIPDQQRRMEAASIIAQRQLTPAQARRLVRGDPPQPARAGKRRMLKAALSEAAAIAERMREKGVDASVSLQSGEKGMCIRIQFQPEKTIEREGNTGKSEKYT